MGVFKLLLYILLVLSLSWFPTRGNENYKYLKEDDLKENEFAEFDSFDEFDDEFAMDETMNKVSESDIGNDESENVDEAQEQLQIEENEEDDPADGEVSFDDDEVDGDDIANEDEEEYERVVDDVFDQGSAENKSTPQVLSFMNFSKHADLTYYVETVLVLGIMIYFTNYVIGSMKNAELASTWFAANSSLLHDNFSLVGDDHRANSQNCDRGKKISDNLFTLWCSGRTCCEGMLVELKFLKRQDLFLHLASNFTRDNQDQIHIKIPLSKEDMDTFVFCVSSKRVAVKLSKEMIDLNTFCPERKQVDKYGLPGNFVVMTELNEVIINFLDNKTVAALTRYSDFIDYIHVSDRYSGLKITEEPSTPTKPLEYKRMLLVGFNFGSGGVDEMVDNVTPLLSLVFYWLDRIKRFRLSKEGKQKADKNRSRIEEVYLKTTHSARNEAAAARSEEKRRKEKERIFQEDDPEKQRKWEEKEMKKQMKKKIPRMKQLKVKSL